MNIKADSSNLMISYQSVLEPDLNNLKLTVFLHLTKLIGIKSQMFR